jgi:cytochrome b
MPGTRLVLRTEIVWDFLVRIFHWTLVVGFLTAYLTEGEPLTLHVWAGYVVAAVIILRIVWGFIGSPHARFSDFIFPVRQVVTHLFDELRLRASRFVGHSPAGGAMVVALLLVLLATTTSGVVLLAVHEGQGPLSSIVGKAGPDLKSNRAPTLATTAKDKERENPTVEFWEETHELFANLALILVILHIGGVVLASFAHKENLVTAMIDGRKRP